MSKLIQLRNRIKAIETIKKITHAMRLIAMSSHSQLKHSQDIISSYTHQLETVFHQLLTHAPQWKHPILNPPTPQQGKVLLVIVGSQKGLCGSFNNHVFKLAHKELKRLENKEVDIVPVGQKVVDFANNLSKGEQKHSYKKFSIRNLSEIANGITNSIFHASPAYGSVIIISNRFKSFFAQIPKAAQLIPSAPQAGETIPSVDEYAWEQQPEKMLDELAFSFLNAHIQLLLFDSLLAEHAARFISMDAATRNANGILEATKLEYNKLRQAKITKELTELSASH